MSAYEVISLAVWTISSVAVIISLYWMNRQTALFAKQTEFVSRSLTESLSESMSNQSHEISRIFLEHPELRPYFFYGQSCEGNNPDYHRAEAAAELILDIYLSMSSQAKRADQRFLETGDPENLWQQYISDAFAHSPILVATLMKRQNWYGQAMVEQMQAGLKRHTPH